MGRRGGGGVGRGRGPMGEAGQKRGRPGPRAEAGGEPDPDQEPEFGPESGPSEESESGFSSSSGSESELESDGEEGAEGDLVDAAFDFKAPEEADYHGVKAVLQSYLDGKPFDSSGLVDTALKLGLGGLGCVVKVEGETIWESCLGVLSLLDTRALASEPCVRDIGAWLQARAEAAGRGAEMRTAWGAEGVGLVVCERVLNLPLELAHPLQASLQNDLKQVGSKVSKFLMLSRVFVDKAKKAGEGGGGTGGKRRKKQRAEAAAAEMEFVRPEDEFFLARAQWSFRFPCAGKSSGGQDLLPHRLVMFIDARGVTQALAALKAKYPPYWETSGPQR